MGKKTLVLAGIMYPSALTGSMTFLVIIGMPGYLEHVAKPILTPIVNEKQWLHTHNRIASLMQHSRYFSFPSSVSLKKGSAPHT